MPAVCFYFQVHQPYRLKRYRIFDIGNDSNYWNDDSDSSRNNRKVFKKVAEKSYLPANAVMLELLREHPEFKISYSLSGVFMEQAEEFAPEVVESFQKLAETGRVEFLAETYYHSLSSLFSPPEFRSQVEEHSVKLKKLLGAEPKVFRNTELIYSNAIAHEVEKLGYLGILTEGADHVLGWRSPNFLYMPYGTQKIKLLLKNYRLSDDIAFRFSSREWSEWPLSASKFSHWVSAVNGSGEVVNLFMDYETFGEHQWADTGIFEFLRMLPQELLKQSDTSFVTPSEAAIRFSSKAVLDIPHPISWADMERDTSAWLSNGMQNEAAQKLYALEGEIKKTNDSELLRDWKRLTTSDHFYYMCTKWWADGDVHKYFSPYESPYEAFIYFMNTLHDVRKRLARYT